MNVNQVNELYSQAAGIAHLYSLLIVKNGYLVAECYYNGFGVYDANPTASVTKSYISALTGIAINEQVLNSIDENMTVFFPEIDWKIQDLRKSQITLKQILQMRSGYPWEEFDGYLDLLFSSSNWIPFLPEFPLTSDPGTRFGYSNFTAHMMAIILTRAAGTSLLDFARIHLFNPLGIEAAYWPTDSLGYHLGCGDIHFTPRDMARFSLLYLNRGLSQGLQIIPADWVDDSLHAHSTTTYETEILESTHQLQYGYLWWSGTSGSHHFDFAWGHGGQLIVLLHDSDMVIVTSADILLGQFGPAAWQKEKQVMEMVGRFISTF